MKVLKSGVAAFAHAAALDKDGRLSNTVYCVGKEVFVFNQDHSVLIRFVFPNSEFDTPLSFRSEDYDSNEMYEENGKIVFVRSNSEFKREKSCCVPGRTPEEIRQIWNQLRVPSGPKFGLSVALVELLDQSLSHTEFRVEDKKLKIIQRNIYSGSITEITKTFSRGKLFSGGALGDEIKLNNYGPVGIRTGDLTALFSFQDNLILTFPEDPASGYFHIAGSGAKPSGLPSHLEAHVALCVYDEMGELSYIIKEEEDGGKEQEVRRSQPRPHRRAEAGSKKS